MHILQPANPESCCCFIFFQYLISFVTLPFWWFNDDIFLWILLVCLDGYWSYSHFAFAHLICLLTIWVSHFVTCLFKYCSYSIWIFLVVSFNWPIGLPYVLWNQGLCQRYVVSISSSALAYLAFLLSWYRISSNKNS